ncbi:unnamed protein product [Clonostachys rosea]|uniref:Uncharacterized protein n=1 Tax=Bionectria ochroleuca TaxID=29856 RepID=A0ABY6UXC1_BIOOC|nr:unnamed protein product [Clonostachys rosea]
MSKLTICTNFSTTLNFPDTDTRRPASPLLSAGPIFAGHAIHRDLMLPTFDPETGLDLFPRLPEDDLDSHSAIGSDDGDVSGEDTTAEVKLNKGNGTSLRRNLSARLAKGVAHFLPKAWSAPSSPVDSEPDQPAQAEQLQSHSPTYCKHTWNRNCKCPVILSSSEGGYCWSCRGERCAAGSSSLRATQLSEITGQ